VFGNRFQDMIEFDSPSSRYLNVSRASSSGLEFEGALVLWPELLRLTGVYTHLDATDERTNLTLQRRPAHSGRIGLAITPFEGLLIEPRVTMVSERFSGNNETLRLHPYARLDIYGEYRFDQTWRVFGRIENITDARYQEVLNFGTTGRAVYAGLSVTW
jgi:vitamin B12 transporter